MTDSLPVPAGPRYSDAARRCSDVVRQAMVDGHSGKWIAIRLSDGGSDDVIYDTKGDAIAHQLHEQQCCYVMVSFDDMSPRAAENFLKLHRQLYDAGYRLVDPDKEIVLPSTNEGVQTWKP